MNPSTTPIRSNVASVLLKMKGNEPAQTNSDAIPSTRPTSASSTSSATSGNSTTTHKSSLHVPIIPTGAVHPPIVDMSGCNCKKSKCLKLYCACFAAQIYCCPTCNCVGCANTVNSINERQDAVKQILDRNPSAFESKFKSITHPWKDPVAAHKTGCRCRKSQCLKKYCECFQAGVICNSICTCIQCANDGSGRPATAILKAKPSELEKEKEKKEIAPTPVRPYPHDPEESIRIAAEVLMRARDDESGQEVANVIIKEESLESIDSLFEKNLPLLQKRKRESEEEGNEVPIKADDDSSTPHTSKRAYLSEISTPMRPSILSRVCPSSRSAVKVSPRGGISTTINNKSYNIISSRFASPNTLICASALSLLSRKDTSPRALSSAAVDCRLSPAMVDRLLPPSSSYKTPGTPCGINYVPQTPEFKAFKSQEEHNKSQECSESPYRCKSAVHLIPDSLENYPTDSRGIPQISLPLFLLSNDDDNWTKPVIDVKSLISKHVDSSRPSSNLG